MPNLRSSRVDKDGIELVASDGRVWKVSRAEIQANCASQVGNAAAKKTKAIAWLKKSVEDALGPEQVPIAALDLDGDLAKGDITVFSVKALL